MARAPARLAKKGRTDFTFSSFEKLFRVSGQPYEDADCFHDTDGLPMRVDVTGGDVLEEVLVRKSYPPMVMASREPAKVCCMIKCTSGSAH